MYSERENTNEHVRMRFRGGVHSRSFKCCLASMPTLLKLRKEAVSFPVEVSLTKHSLRHGKGTLVAEV